MHARKVAITAVLGILVVLLLSSAVPARAADGGLSGMYGGDLRVAVRSALDLNPFTATDAESWKVIPLAYDSLARIDPTTLVPVPWAAESWSISGDELTVELRSDLQFHDGSAVTAADVIYSYNEYKAGGMVASDLAVTAAGSTLTMSSATAGGLLYGQYLTLPIVKSGTSAAPVGGGPWELTDETASSWTLTANADHFWPPYLETVTFSVYADTVSAGADLLRGDIDFIGWTLGVDEPTTVIDVDGVNQTLLADSTILATPGLQQLAFGFNVDPAQPTSDDALRLALARTLNPILFQQIYPNTLRSRSPIIEEDLPWFNPNVPVYQVLVYTAGAPARSTAYLTPSLQLLDAGGYVDRDGDGWREDPTGAQLTLTVVGIPVTEDARQFTIQEASVDIFTRMGVRAFLVSVASSQIEARIASGDYDVFINRFWSALDPGFMWDYLHSAGASNVFGVDNAALDGYLDEANAALDPASRATAAMAAQLEAMNGGFFVPVLHFNAVESVARGAFDGWVQAPGGVNNFWTYQMLHAPPAGALHADVTLVPNSVEPGGTTTAIARVFDQNDAAVADATVTFWMDGVQVGVAGTTGPSGTLSRDITAPDVDGATDVEIAIEVTKLGYGGTGASAEMTVAPVSSPLSVAVSSSAATIDSGGSATITVTVTAATVAVSGATVSLEIVGLGGGVEAAQGPTNAQGVFTTTFNADVGPRTQFRIVATATAAGYGDGSGSTSIIVEQRVGAIEPRVTPGLDIGTIIVAVVALVAIAGLAVYMARKR